MKSKEKRKIEHFDLVDLETAYLLAYSAWLKLDSNYKQLYPCPKYPTVLKPLIKVTNLQNHYDRSEKKE